jgi:hypothetical protein
VGYTEDFINLAVISDYVYIGGKHSLIQLNSSLGIVNIKPTNGRNWLLTPYKAGNEETFYLYRYSLSKNICYQLVVNRS